jgi:hypothetical protein
MARCLSETQDAALNHKNVDNMHAIFYGIEALRLGDLFL